MDFEGQTREGFDDDFEAITGDLDGRVSSLRDQLEQLDAALATARARQQENRDAIDAWSRDKAAYDDYWRTAAGAQAGAIP